MTIRNRELSQFGSFIHVENSSQEIGITTGALPYVGIGTTNPQYKLDVTGNANVSGAVSATGYYLNGAPLVSAASQYWDASGSDIYLLVGGNVGIGNSLPTSKLSVTGNVIISGVTTASRFISTVSTGTAPLTVNSQTLVTNLNSDYLRGKTPPTGDIVGTTDAQTLTSKSLTLPTFGGTGVAFTGSASGSTTVRASATASGTIVLPAVSGIATVITTGDTGTINSNMISDLSITNSDIATSAGIVYSKLNLSNSIVNADIASGAAIAVSKLASSTISGVSLGSALNSLTAGSYIIYDSGITYNGSSTRIIGVAATTLNTANTVVARDASGDFSVGTITGAAFNATTTDAYRVGGITVSDSNRQFIPVSIQAGGTVGTAGSILSSTGSGIEWIEAPGGFSVTDDTSTDSSYYPVFVNATTGKPSQTSVSSINLQFNPSTGNLSATQFTSLSDATQKTNIRPIENPIEITKKLDGVRFDWITNNKPSLGLIAQEVEKVLPELVETSTDGTKSVSYGNIVGVLIEAIKEQQVRIEELERKLNA